MIGDTLSYVAHKAASKASLSLNRRLSAFAWVAVSLAFVFVGTIFALIAGYFALQPELGSVGAAATIAGCCLAIALLCQLFRLVRDDWSRRKEAKIAAQLANSSPGQVVQTEAREVVDYFGPAKVMASAFFLGVGVARRLRP